jgi:hypothetical protein
MLTEKEEKELKKLLEKQQSGQLDHPERVRLLQLETHRRFTMKNSIIAILLALSGLVGCEGARGTGYGVTSPTPIHSATDWPTEPIPPTPTEVAAKVTRDNFARCLEQTLLDRGLDTTCFAMDVDFHPTLVIQWTGANRVSGNQLQRVVKSAARKAGFTQLMCSDTHGYMNLWRL